jgi:hypothetical protein
VKNACEDPNPIPRLSAIEWLVLAELILIESLAIAATIAVLIGLLRRAI